MAEFRARKTDAGLVFDSRDDFDSFVSEVPGGSIVLVRLSVLGDDKTAPQLGEWYREGGILWHSVRAFKEAGMNTLGEIKERLDVDMEVSEFSVDLLFKRLWHASKLKPGVPSKANMSKQEMSELIDFAHYFVGSRLGYTIPKEMK